MDTTEVSKKKFYKQWWFWVIVVVVVLIVIGSSNSGSSNTPSYQSSQSICDTDPQALAKETFVPDYKQLDKDPSASQGTVATFTGQIVQIQQSGGEGVIRLSVTKESYGWSPSDIVYVTYHKATDAVQGDVVSVTGMLTGAETYTSQANFQITIPSIDVCSIDTKPVAPMQASAPRPKTTTQTSAPQSSTPAPAASWHTVATFSGQSAKNTPSFAIRGSQWRVSWQENGDTIFGATAESPDGSGDFCPIANTGNSGSDTSYCYTPGNYYITVNTANSWTMTIEDYY
jgi:hypothetical protein